MSSWWSRRNLNVKDWARQCEIIVPWGQLFLSWSPRRNSRLVLLFAMLINIKHGKYHFLDIINTKKIMIRVSSYQLTEMNLCHSFFDKNTLSNLILLSFHHFSLSNSLTLSFSQSSLTKLDIWHVFWVIIQFLNFALHYQRTF